jgi:hypothetical protein
VLATEDHDTSVGSNGVEVREANGASNANPSFRYDFFDELRGLLKDIFRAK